MSTKKNFLLLFNRKQINNSPPLGSLSATLFCFLLLDILILNPYILI